jgi:hypothetical protein
VFHIEPHDSHIIPDEQASDCRTRRRVRKDYVKLGSAMLQFESVIVGSSGETKKEWLAASSYEP